MQAGRETLENSTEVPKKLKIELPYNPAIALQGIYPKDKNVVIQRGTCSLMLLAAMFKIARLWKEPRCPPTDDKEDVVYVCMCLHTYTHTHTHPLISFV